MLCPAMPCYACLLVPSICYPSEPLPCATTLPTVLFFLYCTVLYLLSRYVAMYLLCCIALHLCMYVGPFFRGTLPPSYTARDTCIREAPKNQSEGTLSDSNSSGHRGHKHRSRLLCHCQVGWWWIGCRHGTGSSFLDRLPPPTPPPTASSFPVRTPRVGWPHRCPMYPSCTVNRTLLLRVRSTTT